MTPQELDDTAALMSGQQDTELLALARQEEESLTQRRDTLAKDIQRVIIAGDPSIREPRGINNLPTSGLAIFDFATDDWTDLAFRRGRLVQFVSPKLLKQTLDD